MEPIGSHNHIFGSNFFPPLSILNLFTMDLLSHSLPESPQVVNKYFCSFLWCALSRVSTGTLSWLEGTLQALQRINIRASISRATKMLHTIATTAAVESPVVDTVSSQSHSCIADTVEGLLWINRQLRSSNRRLDFDPWPVIKARCNAVYFKARLLISPSRCHSPPSLFLCF